MLKLVEPDTLSARGANQLALQIMQYWSGLGLKGVRAWLEPLRVIEEGKPSTMFQVRSNVAERIKKSLS